MILKPVNDKIVVKKQNKKEAECILALADGQYQDVQVVDKEINFMSTIVKLLRIIR